MEISQLQAFRVFIHEDDRVSEMRRNPFSQCERDAFIFEQRGKTGEILHQCTVMESTAEISLRCALALFENKPELVSVEFDKLSTGTVFNYPVPQV